MDFRPLNDTERTQLVEALKGNADKDSVIFMDKKDTSFRPTNRVAGLLGKTDEVSDEETINAIKSIPVHY
jgi:hypothetical protein